MSLIELTRAPFQGLECAVGRRATCFKACKDCFDDEILFDGSTEIVLVDDDFKAKVTFVPVFADDEWPVWAKFGNFNCHDFYSSHFYLAVFAWIDGKEHR